MQHHPSEAYIGIKLKFLKREFALCMWICVNVKTKIALLYFAPQVFFFGWFQHFILNLKERKVGQVFCLTVGETEAEVLCYKSFYTLIKELGLKFCFHNTCHSSDEATYIQIKKYSQQITYINTAIYIKNQSSDLKFIPVC